MFYGGAIIIWLVGLWCTYDGMKFMGVEGALIASFILQVILSFGQSLIVNERYRELLPTQQKIILLFAAVAIALDIWLNYRGLDGKLGNPYLIMPGEMQQQLGQLLLNTIVQWFAAFVISVLPEILFSVGRIYRRRSIQ
jgi:hypothetical protein